MRALNNSLPCSRVPAFASATLLGSVSKWIWIIIHACANSHPCSRRLWTVWLPAWTTSLAHNWAHHSCFPPSPPVANPACNRIFWWRRVLVLPSTFFVSPAFPSPWRFYCDCDCRERVDCLVNVTGEFKSVNPVWNTQVSHSQMSLNSSQTGQQHPVQ